MYRNVVSYMKNNVDYIWESTFDENGERIILETPIKPYLYYEDGNLKQSEYKSMFGKCLRKKVFSNSRERSEWIDTSKNVPLFEKFSLPKQYLMDKYCGKERDNDFIKYSLRTFFIDIEVEIQNEFPEAAFAMYPINVISLYDTLTNSVHVWAYKKDVFEVFTAKDDDDITKEIQKDYIKDVKVYVYKFDREYQLLEHFLKFWEKNTPDVVSGWNIEKFDIVYIINRIKKVMPENSERRLSPIVWHKYAIKQIKEQQLKEATVRYQIMGVSICDYLVLYKKFIPKSQQSWKLDYIAKKDLGKGKLDYYEIGYESMKEFMNKDFKTFVKYNMIDTLLVKLLDDERYLIQLMRRICNMGLCEYESIFKTTPYILGALCIEARHQGVKFLTDSNKDEEHKVESDGFEGAFVFPTKAGFYKNGVMSFDFNSLYPNVIMSINMSPETLVGKIITEIGEKTDTVDIRKMNGKIVTITKEKLDSLLETKCCISANNVLFLKSNVKWGIMPSFLEKLYKGRVSIKTEMKATKKKVHELDEQIKELEQQLQNCN